jgi:DNA-directed RNA polymerase III subunit RPC1
MALAQRIYEDEEEEEMPIVKAGKGRKAKPVARVRKLKPRRAPIELLPGWEGCHEKYRENTFGFIKNKIVKAMSDQRLRRGVPPGDSAEEAEEYSLDASDREFLVSSCDPTIVAIDRVDADYKLLFKLFWTMPTK